jgi:transposase InsO family protein
MNQRHSPLPAKEITLHSACPDSYASNPSHLDAMGVVHVGFALKSSHAVGIAEECRRQDFWRNVALQRPSHTAPCRSFAVNHKHVLLMMREDNLLCVRRRTFVVTTDSRHNLPIYPNLARVMKPTAINQLWVADITYIRLRTEFVYLAVVLDAFSRRVIGWALGRTLEAELAERGRRAGQDLGCGRQPRNTLCLHVTHCFAKWFIP